MSSFFLFGPPCNMKKVVSAEHFQSYMINHYYPQKHVSWTGVYKTNEVIRGGRNGVPECFAQTVNQTKFELIIGNNSTQLQYPMSWTSSTKFLHPIRSLTNDDIMQDIGVHRRLLFVLIQLLERNVYDGQFSWTLIHTIKWFYYDKFDPSWFNRWQHTDVSIFIHNYLHMSIYCTQFWVWDLLPSFSSDNYS